MPLHLMATLQGPTKTLSDPSEFQTLLAVTNAHISLHSPWLPALDVVPDANAELPVLEHIALLVNM